MPAPTRRPGAPGATSPWSRSVGVGLSRLIEPPARLVRRDLPPRRDARRRRSRCWRDSRAAREHGRRRRSSRSSCRRSRPSPARRRSACARRAVARCLGSLLTGLVVGRCARPRGCGILAAEDGPDADRPDGRPRDDPHRRVPRVRRRRRDRPGRAAGRPAPTGRRSSETQPGPAGVGDARHRRSCWAIARRPSASRRSAPPSVRR